MPSGRQELLVVACGSFVAALARFFRLLLRQISGNILPHRLDTIVHQVFPMRVGSIVYLPAFHALSGRVTSLKTINERRSIAPRPANLISITIEKLLDVLIWRCGGCHMLGASASHSEGIPSPQIRPLRSEADSTPSPETEAGSTLYFFARTVTAS